MDEIRKIFKKTGNLHHAYLLVGEREAIAKSIVEFLEKDLQISIHGNPDFLLASYDACGIDEARTLKARTAMRAIEKMKVVILSFNSITTEAQNSLLKIFEDGPSNTTFFVIASTLEIFLPTLLSRFFIVREGERVGEGVSAQNAQKFFSSNPAERITQLSDLIENKDKTQTIQFFNSLESFIQEKLVKKNGTGENYSDKSIVAACEELLRSKTFLYDRSPSVKMILEHISCTMPVLEN